MLFPALTPALRPAFGAASPGRARRGGPVVAYPPHANYTFDRSDLKWDSDTVTFDREGDGIPSGPTYLVSEDFEGAGTPSGWTVTAGTPDFDYTTSPIVGAHSLQMTSTESAYKTFTAQSDVWVFFRWRKDVQGTNANNPLMNIQDASGVNLVNFSNRVDGTLRIYCGSVFDGLTLKSVGVNHAVWLHYTKGTGANAVLQAYVQADGTENRPASPEKTITTGTATADAARVVFNGDIGATEIYDKVRVLASSIGSSPL